MQRLYINVFRSFTRKHNYEIHLKARCLLMFQQDSLITYKTFIRLELIRPREGVSHADTLPLTRKAIV